MLAFGSIGASALRRLSDRVGAGLLAVRAGDATSVYEIAKAGLAPIAGHLRESPPRQPVPPDPGLRRVEL